MGPRVVYSSHPDLFRVLFGTTIVASVDGASSYSVAHNHAPAHHCAIEATRRETPAGLPRAVQSIIIHAADRGYMACGCTGSGSNRKVHALRRKMPALVPKREKILRGLL